MISGTNPTATAPPATTVSQQKLIPAANDQLANKETFLQLLVAQIKNQNPLSPSDGVQFLSQLAQFSDLEQAMSMRKELESIHALLDKAALPPAAGAVPSHPEVK